MITARTLKFTGGTTNIITQEFNVHGDFNVEMSVQSSTGSPATISANIGTINCKYLNLTNIAAVGGSVWNAINSIDSGGNSGWVFSLIKEAQVLVLGTWKTITKMQIKINGAWKQIRKAQIKVSGVWKNIF